MPTLLRIIGIIALFLDASIALLLVVTFLIAVAEDLTALAMEYPRSSVFALLGVLLLVALMMAGP